MRSVGYGSWRPDRTPTVTEWKAFSAQLSPTQSLNTFGAVSCSTSPRSCPSGRRLTNPTAATVPCTLTEQIDVGLQVVAPFLDTHARDRCTTANTATGIGLSYGIRFLQLMAGALAALFIAGFTGVVRKT